MQILRLCLHGAWDGSTPPSPAGGSSTVTIAALAVSAWTRMGSGCVRRRQVRAEDLETAVWTDVCALLADPTRVEQEYERRLEGSPADGGGVGTEALSKRIVGVKRAISRLIDSYSEGLLEKEEFEPRLRGARERLVRLEAEVAQQADASARRSELRVVIGKLQEFAEGIKAGLKEADWGMRREVIRAW